jgi:hypothetical protein
MALGDVLLLQVIKSTLDRPSDSRVGVALIFDLVREDAGDSLRIWGTAFQYLIKASSAHAFDGFNLEDLGLGRSYSQQGMQSHQRIDVEDVAAVQAAIRRGLTAG